MTCPPRCHYRSLLTGIVPILAIVVICMLGSTELVPEPKRLPHWARPGRV